MSVIKKAMIMRNDLMKAMSKKIFIGFEKLKQPNIGFTQEEE